MSTSVSPVEQLPTTLDDCVYCEVASSSRRSWLLNQCHTEHDGVGIACRICSVSAYSSTLFDFNSLSFDPLLSTTGIPPFPSTPLPASNSPCVAFYKRTRTYRPQALFQAQLATHTRTCESSSFFDESASQLSSPPIVSTPLTSCCQGATATNGL